MVCQHFWVQTEHLNQTAQRSQPQSTTWTPPPRASIPWHTVTTQAHSRAEEHHAVPASGAELRCAALGRAVLFACSVHMVLLLQKGSLGIGAKREVSASAGAGLS